MATKTEIQYRATQLSVPLGRGREFMPVPPEGEGWAPMSIGGTETVFYTLWSRLVEVETDEAGNVIRVTNLVK